MEWCNYQLSLSMSIVALRLLGVLIVIADKSVIGVDSDLFVSIALGH